MFASSRKRQSQPKELRKRSVHHGGKQGSHKDSLDHGSDTSGVVRERIRTLNAALDEDPVDVSELRRLTVTSRGCVTNELRCRVWPKLMNVNIFEFPRRKTAEAEARDFQENKWWYQVNLDINRSDRRLPEGARVCRRRVLKQQLTNIIMRVLCRRPDLNYYQGYHDIAVTLLRVVGEEHATALLDQISTTHVRDFMDVTMMRTNKMLAFFHPIMSAVDGGLAKFLQASEVGTIFALSWLITWFGHDINGFDVIVRLFDFFLSSHPLMPVYVAVALAHQHRERVLNVDCEMAMVHHCLSKLPLLICMDDVEHLISRAHQTFMRHPPESLQKAVRAYLRESASVSRHSELVQRSYAQRPDSVLRKRRRCGMIARDLDVSALKAADATITLQVVGQTNTSPLVKIAVWTMTMTMGVMTFLLLNTSKYWL